MMLEPDDSYSPQLNHKAIGPNEPYKQTNTPVENHESHACSILSDASATTTAPPGRRSSGDTRC
jgi:hypothetical protein